MKHLLTTLILSFLCLAAGADSLVTPPAGAEGKMYYAAAYSYAKGDNRAFTINILRDGDAIYIQGLYPELPEAWISGTMRPDNVAVFPSGQYLGTVDPTKVDDSHEVFNVYFYCSMDLNKSRNLELYYNPINDTYEATYQYLLFSEKDNLRARYEHMQNLNVFSGAHISTTAPENLQTLPYRLQGYECSIGKNLDYSIEVGFDGQDVYVRGISDAFPEAWVRGTREPAGLNKETVRFMRNQYLGPYNLGGKTYDIWFTGINHDEAYFTEVIFDYDPTTGVFSQQEGNWLVINGNPVEWRWLNNMSNVELVPDESEDEVDYYALITPPANLSAQPFTVSGSDCIFNFEKGDALTPYEVKVGFEENNCYIQGLFTDMPDSWLRGDLRTIDGRLTLTIPSPQYLGKWFGSMDSWFMAVDKTGVYAENAIRFTYDETQGAFVQQTGTYIFLNDAFDAPSEMFLQALKDVVLAGKLPDAIHSPYAAPATDARTRKLCTPEGIVIRKNGITYRLDGRKKYL